MKRLLTYLCERAYRGDSEPVSEYELAVQVLHRPKDFDPRIDPIVRVNMGSLRERLQTFFSSEGRTEGLRVLIPKGQYRVVFCEAGSPLDECGSGNALARFWRPYLSEESRNILLYTELLFLRNREGSFLRNLYINDPGTAVRDFQKQLPDVDLGELTPSFNFISAGEVHFMFSAIEMFRAFGVSAQCRNWRLCSWNDLQDSNLIALGSSRTNTFLDSLQGGNDFVIAADCIENRNPAPHEQKEYRGSRYHDGKLERVSEYVLVTRRPGLSPQSCITSIAANHSRPFEGAASRLLTEAGVNELFESMRINASTAIPRHFQLLFRVDLVNYDEQLINVEYVTHHVIPLGENGKQAAKH